MKIKDLLPYLPKFNDNSGYDVVINFLTRNNGTKLDWNHIVLHKIDDNNMVFKRPFKSNKEILELDIEKIDSYRVMAGGNIDDSLQIYVSNLDYVK